MGLLGTVLGIIKTFKAMALYGTGNAKSFSAGISEALITTAEGLIVAIPVLVIHGMLKSYRQRKFSEFEAIGIALVNGTTERERKANPTDALPRCRQRRRRRRTLPTPA
jgi:biopolymer transport protein ExbB